MNKKYELMNEANHNFTSNRFYVYELINPTTELPFYVGKGRDDRAWRHISLRKNNKVKRTNLHLYRTINKIINGGNLVIIKIVTTHDTESHAFDQEQILINKYGRVVDGSGILTNLLRGGEGYTQDGRAVDQFTMWGEYIKTYKNAKEAARLNMWPTYSVITSCCNRRERSYKGFLWAYAGCKPELLKRVKPVYQWTLEGQFVNVYRNASVASRLLKCDPTTISDCVRGDIHTAVGFIWTSNNVPPNLNSHRNSRNKPVKHINTNIVYNSVTEAAVATAHNIGAVSACCNGRKPKIGKDYFCYVLDQ